MDQIAKLNLNSEVDVHISWGRVELREIIKEGLTKEWQRGWEKESRGRHYFSLQSEVKKRCTCTFQSRRDSVKLCIEAGSLWAKSFFIYCRKTCFWFM